MEITETAGDLRAITGNITNKSKEMIPEGLIGLIFDVEGEEITMPFYHLPINSGTTFPLEYQHNNDKIIKADDYKIIEH